MICQIPICLFIFPIFQKHIDISDIVYGDEEVKNTFYTSIDQILVMWIKVWGTLNEYEKKIIITIMENEQTTWKTIDNKTDFFFLIAE